MGKMPGKTKSIELKELRDKCLLFNQFIIEKGQIPILLHDAYNEANRLVEKAYAEGNIKPLKAMNADIDDQVIRRMPLPMALELKLLFKEKLNIDFDAIDKRRIKTIEKLLSKRKISKPEEYELLLNRADEIYVDTSKEDEMKKINELLSGYHK